MGTPNLRLIGQSPWIAVTRTMKKPSFKLWNSNLTSVDITRAEAQGISDPTVHCVIRNRIDRAVIPPEPEIRYGARKRRLPVGAGHPSGEELGFVKALGGRDEQGLSPHDIVDVATKCKYKSGLLVTSATVKGFAYTWSILIDSGESVNYFRRRSLEESQRYDEALKAHRDFITVRLPSGARVTVPKVLLILGVKF